MIVRVASRHPLWVVFTVAFAIRLAYVLISRLDPFNMVDSLEYDDIANGLLAGRGYTTGAGNIFLRPPLYPLFVAASYAVGGMLALQIGQLVLSSATAVLVGLLARRLWSDPAASVVAGLGAAVYPWTFAYVGGLASETLFTFLWVATTIVVVGASRHGAVRAAAVAGLLFGAAALTRSNLLVLGPGIAAWLWWTTRSIRSAATFGTIAVISLLPFAAYNLATGNGLVISSNGGGESFYLGNNPGETALYAGRLSGAEARAASFLGRLGEEYINCPKLRCVYEISMAERDGFFYRAGLQYIRSHPMEAAITDARKFFHYWRPWVDPDAYSMPVVVVTGVTFSGLLGLAVLGWLRMPRTHAALVLIIAALATATAVIWHVQLRYRFALLDPLLLAAGAGPVALWVRSTSYAPIAAVRAFVFAARRVG